MTEEKVQTVGQILDRFDFEKVHRYMKQVDWKWRDAVPTIEDLRGTAAHLLVEAMLDPQEVVSMGTGGFRVYKLPWGLELVFALNRSGSF
jgi:hypothetical protein